MVEPWKETQTCDHVLGHQSMDENFESAAAKAAAMESVVALKVLEGFIQSRRRKPVQAGAAIAC